MALLTGAKTAVRSVQCTGVSRARDVPPGAQEWESGWAVRQLSDGRYLIERAKGNVYFDGVDCWFVRADRKQAVKSPVPLPSLLMNAIAPEWLHTGVRLTDLGESIVEGRPCRSVDARTRDGEEHYSLTVDQETGLILRSRDERTGLEFELHDVVVNGDIDESSFRPDLGPDVERVRAGTSHPRLTDLVKAAVRSRWRPRS